MRMEKQLEQLRLKVTNWTDTSMEGLQKRTNIESNIYAIKRKIQFRDHPNMGYLGIGENIYDVKL